MSRIKQQFEIIKKANRAALITYICAGDPDLDTTEKLVHALASAGADIIELGIPFSDPIADGPTIQRAAQRALKHHTNLNQIIELVTKLRKTTQIPIVFMGYYNPILHMGLETFVEKAVAAGVDGVIIPDLPPDEGNDWMQLAHAAGLDTIYLLAPTSTDERISKVTAVNRGFNYYVSVTGVTGARTSVQQDVSIQVAKIKKLSSIPVCVGFGISQAQQVQELVQAGADGVIVGSAIINVIEQNLENPKLVELVGKFVQSLTPGLVRS